MVCLNSAWQDFVADAIAGAMDEFGIDGVYLDGTEFPAGCINTLHGCGSTRPDGSIAKSYPIFGVRSAMRRIHNAVTSRKPEGQINVHNSTCMVMPTLGFGTSYWDGEQFQDVRGIDHAATQLPLDAFRAEFMGRQWGVPAEFLCYGQGFTFEQAWAVTLIHDVPVRPMSRPGLEDLELTSRIWRIMDDFGRGSAEFVPYWSNAEYVRADPAGIHVSLYRHPANGVLAVVSNLSRERTAFALTVSWELLGLDRATASIVDGFGAVTGSPGRRSRSVRLAAALDQAIERLAADRTRSRTVRMVDDVGSCERRTERVSVQQLAVVVPGFRPVSPVSALLDVVQVERQEREAQQEPHRVGAEAAVPEALVADQDAELAGAVEAVGCADALCERHEEEGNFTAPDHPLRVCPVRTRTTCT